MSPQAHTIVLASSLEIIVLKTISPQPKGALSVLILT